MEYNINIAEESSLAWDLTSVTAPWLSPEDYLWVCAKIGAGEQGSAISDMLAVLVRAKAKLPIDLVQALMEWIGGYAGSDTEPGLLRLMSKIGISTLCHSTSREGSAHHLCIS
ncbi:hypothetical protein [Mycolicibacterium vinylchloridicum]|uniref:hypothetical protein n=1 Tax=Mycolicibacterium vinylchloridicum TaxID=2736928 RepID=UPI00055C81BB|nr:hypothetical protein [Mycolicibacterium vinylchloridicum]